MDDGCIKQILKHQVKRWWPHMSIRKLFVVERIRTFLMGNQFFFHAVMFEEDKTVNHRKQILPLQRFVSNNCFLLWVFPKIGYPQIIPFNKVFHYFHHPFWGLKPPIFGNPQPSCFLEWPVVSHKHLNNKNTHGRMRIQWVFFSGYPCGVYFFSTVVTSLKQKISCWQMKTPDDLSTV